MLLFDVGAVLFCTGLMLLIWFLLKRQNNYQAKLVTMIICIAMEIIGGVLMVISHYLVEGNVSAITNML